jgi:hypothetical protein
VSFAEQRAFAERVADCFVVGVRFGCFVSSFEECLVKFLSLIINQKVKELLKYSKKVL